MRSFACFAALGACEARVTRTQDLFSGPADLPSGLGAQLETLAGLQCLEFDLLNGDNLLDDTQYRRLIHECKSGLVVGAHAGFPCEAFSPARKEWDGGSPSSPNP